MENDDGKASVMFCICCSYGLNMYSPQQVKNTRSTAPGDPKTQLPRPGLTIVILPADVYYAPLYQTC